MRKVKIVALVLSAALALQFSIPAFAAAPVDDTTPSTSENIAAEQVDMSRKSFSSWSLMSDAVMLKKLAAQ